MKAGWGVRRACEAFKLENLKLGEQKNLKLGKQKKQKLDYW